MPSYNRIILAGNLTREPELAYTKGNMAYCKCGMAVNHKYKDTEEVCFVDFIVWGKQGETFNQYMAKGRPVLIEGRLRLDQWEKDGKKHSRHGVVVEKFVFIGGKQDSGGSTPAKEDARDPDDIPF